MESTSKPQGSNPEGSPEAYAGLNPGLEGSSSAVRPAVDGRSGGNGEGGDSPGKGCSLSFPALQRLTSVFIRGMQLALCCASFSVMVSADEAPLKYSDIMAFRFLVAATVLAAAWSLVALAADALRLAYPKPNRSLTLLFALAIGDWVALMLALGGGSAPAGLGSPPLNSLCSLSPSVADLCTKSRTAAVLALIAAAFFLPSLAMDVGEIVERKYGQNRGDRLDKE